MERRLKYIEVRARGLQAKLLRPSNFEGMWSPVHGLNAEVLDALVCLCSWGPEEGFVCRAARSARK